MACVVLGWRFFQWFRIGDGRGTGLCDAGQRHRWFNQAPGGGVRDRWPEADLGPGESIRSDGPGAFVDHVGPLTRSAGDAGIVLQAISGSDPNDVTTLPHEVPTMLAGVGTGVKGLKIGWDEDYSTVDMEPSFAAAVEAGVRVMEDLGAEIVPVKMPAILREAMAAWPVICSSEAAVAHSATFPSRASEYGPFLRGWLENGSGHTATEYARAHGLRLALNGGLRDTMRNIDVLACPSTSRASYPVTPEFLYGPIPPDRDPWSSRFTVPYDFSGLPAIALPCGLDDNGMPVSLQFAGHHLAEPILVRVGDAFERATEFHNLHPPV